MSAQLISLASIAPIGALGAEAKARAEAPAPVSLDGGCASSKCGSSDGPADMPAEIWEKVKDHPCYSEEAHHYFARMHVAVAPACNIQCNYCNRKYDCANESRPGVVSERLTPEQAMRKVLAVAAEVPQLSVLGIAGPGDSLYDAKKTFETFKLVDKSMPDLKFCVSTNGLSLPEHVDRLADYNIDHVTITINMVDPEVGEKIYPGIYFKNKRWTGRDAAKILHERQMEGLEALTAKGILVKVNSVMIPGINDQHLLEVNRWVKERGAFLHNVMPLISEAEHGTWFGLNGQRGPTPAELKDLQDNLDGGAKLMKHCRQCRADAVGLLGEDRGQEFTLDKLPEAVEVDPEKRRVYREVVEKERAERQSAAKEANGLLAAEASTALLIAVATKGGGRVNEHFGHAREFQVYEVDARGVRFQGHRRTPNYCEGGWGEEETLDDVIKALEGVRIVLCSKIGHCPQEQLQAAGITATDAYALEWIETAATAAYAAHTGIGAAAPTMACA